MYSYHGFKPTDDPEKFLQTAIEKGWYGGLDFEGLTEEEQKQVNDY